MSGPPSHETVPGSHRPRGAPRTLAISVLLAGLTLVQGWPVLRHALRAADPLVFNDDVRQQIVPFLLSRAGLPADEPSDYFLACLPLGFRSLYEGAVPLIDPAALSKVLPYVLLLVTLAGAVIAGRGLAGWPGAVITGALLLSTDVFLERMVGGLPRAFAHPLGAVAAAALVSGRPLVLAVDVVVAMAFYPVAALAAGLALALTLLALPGADQGHAASWSWRQRGTLLAVTAGLALAIHLPTAITCDRYGPVIGPGDVAAYPEAGPGGRYDPDDRAPYRSFAADAYRIARRTVQEGGSRWIAPLEAPSGAWAAGLGILAAGFAGLAARRPAARRLATLAVAALVAHTAARLAAPRLYLPQRYVAYTVPLLVVLLVPALAVALGQWLACRLPPGRSPSSRLPAAAGGVLAGAVLLLLGGHVSVDAGFAVRLPAGTGLYRYLRTLPPTVLVAGWPAGPVENVPYVARRRAFLTFETHQALHRVYADEMRRRARAVIDAYLATTWEPVTRLRDDLGVTHLIVDGQDLGSRRPTYFAPFDAWIAEAWARGRRDGFVLRHPPAAALVFSEGSLVVLDLLRLPAHGSRQSSGWGRRAPGGAEG